MNSRSKAPVRLAFSLAVALCLSACGQEPPVADVPMTVQEAMVEHIDVVADEVWAVGNAAMAGNSVLDRNLMTDTDWARLVDAATRLQTSANRLGFMDRYVVSRTGVVISDGRAKGGIASAQVQEYIDADVSGFRGLAAALASHSNDLAAAAKARDATRAEIGRAHV